MLLFFQFILFAIIFQHLYFWVYIIYECHILSEGHVVWPLVSLFSCQDCLILAWHQSIISMVYLITRNCPSVYCFNNVSILQLSYHGIQTQEEEEKDITLPQIAFHLCARTWVNRSSQNKQRRQVRSQIYTTNGSLRSFERGFKRTKPQIQGKHICSKPICIPAAYVLIALMRSSVYSAFHAQLPYSVMYHP